MDNRLSEAPKKMLSESFERAVLHNSAITKSIKRVNMLKPNTYEAHVKDLKNTKPRKWWSDFGIQRLSGMSKANINIATKLLDI